VARFTLDGIFIELFGQALYVDPQRAYRHMIIESRLLDLFGKDVRNNIREIKLSGLKTEPAFGQYFKLEGDPYLGLPEFGRLKDKNLCRISSLIISLFFL